MAYPIRSRYDTGELGGSKYGFAKYAPEQLPSNAVMGGGAYATTTRIYLADRDCEGMTCSTP